MELSTEQLAELLREAAKQGAQLALNQRVNPKPEWLTGAEAMAMLNVGRTTLWRYETRNVLKTNNADGQLKRYHRKTLENLISNGNG